MKLLVVEDDVAIADAMVELLAEEGFDVSHATDGRDALRHLRRAESLPEAIILDLRMPTMDGWAFRAEQRKDPALAAIPVLAISADASPQAEAIDAAGFLKKPVDTRAVVSEVRRILNEARARELNEQNAHRDRLAALGRLAAGMAHEINNPLAWVAANLKLLRERLPELSAAARPELEKTRKDVDLYLSELDDLVRESEEGARRIRDIVQQVKSFSQPQGARALRVDVRGVAESAIKMAELQLRHKVRVERHLGATPWVNADDTQLGQVFQNLLQNAGDAVMAKDADGGVIRVQTRTDEAGRAVVEIADEGIGIPAAVKQKIFEPFFTTKPHGKGTGLGLFLCHNIVTALGGELRMDSEVGRGTRVTIALPPCAQPRSDTGQPKLAVSGRKRLLIVEDEPVLGRALQRLLNSRYEVALVASANAAVQALERDQGFDAVLCDVHMPERGGADLFEEVSHRWPQLAARMLFMSGGALSDHTQTFIDKMEGRVLAKPLELEALESAVTRLLT